MAKYYVGLSATLHDPALAIVDSSGRALFAEATERYLQNKRAFNAPPDDLLRLPNLLQHYCDDSAPEFVAAISWSAPYLHRLELIAPALAARHTIPTSDLAWPGLDASAMTLSLRNSLSQASLNLAASWRTPGPVTVRRYDHHLTHAATAAFTGPYQECVIAVVDGYGEDGSTACYKHSDGRLTRLDVPTAAGPPLLPTSLGHFYSLVCAACGFDPWRGEEWKVMGLAGYGRFDSDLYALFRPMISVDGLTLTSRCSVGDFMQRAATLRMRSLHKDRPEDQADLAFTGQHVFEEVMTEFLGNLYDAHPSPVLSLGGGCALNSSFNGKIIERTPFKRVYVPSAPADDGSALGAAYLAWRDDEGHLPRPASTSAYLGSSMSEEALERLRTYGRIKHERHGAAIADVTARALTEGLIVGWVQGRAEFGPRALGNRSILADPRSAAMRARINDHVKFREAFRPLAPSILDDHGDAWFEHYQTSPYMERALRFRPEMRARVPAVVHVDGTGRVHSVRQEWNARFHAVVSAFYERTDVPILLNTSFNVMGKPIVHSVEDAVAVFLTSDLDWLVIDEDVWRK